MVYTSHPRILRLESRLSLNAVFNNHFDCKTDAQAHRNKIQRERNRRPWLCRQPDRERNDLTCRWQEIAISRVGVWDSTYLLGAVWSQRRCQYHEDTRNDKSCLLVTHQRPSLRLWLSILLKFVEIEI